MARMDTPVTAEALTVHAAPGDIPHLGEPIPRWALLGLPALMHPLLREWLQLEAGHIALCGHTFRVVAWSEQYHALMVKHECCL